MNEVRRGEYRGNELSRKVYELASLSRASTIVGDVRVILENASESLTWFDFSKSHAEKLNVICELVEELEADMSQDETARCDELDGLMGVIVEPDSDGGDVQ